MTAHVTKRFAYFLADQIFESVSEATPTRLYTVEIGDKDIPRLN